MKRVEIQMRMQMLTTQPRKSEGRFRKSLASERSLRDLTKTFKTVGGLF
jgi:hypothetical protein